MCLVGIIRVVASVMLKDGIQQVYIPLQADLMIMLNAKLVKKCSTTALMHRLSQFGASENGIPKMCKHMKVSPKTTR